MHRHTYGPEGCELAIRLHLCTAGHTAGTTGFWLYSLGEKYKAPVLLIPYTPMLRHPFDQCLMLHSLVGNTFSTDQWPFVLFVVAGGASEHWFAL